MTMTKHPEQLPRPAAELERLAEYYETHATGVGRDYRAAGSDRARPERWASPRRSEDVLKPRYGTWGIEPAKRETYDNGVTRVIYRDAEGNLLRPCGIERMTAAISSGVRAGTGSGAVSSRAGRSASVSRAR
jgi:hypothetical protein